jgi:hypothetical protein|tara:strand:+ start:2352 stop:2750 length:399 start_codon:yes stop_codon:yes gene_type:complete
MENERKRIAYIPEVEKMKGLKPGQSAVVKFTGAAEIVNIVYKDRATGSEIEKEKHHFPILLLSHPDYPHLKESGSEMVWETVCSEAVALHAAIPEMMKAGGGEAKALVKHYNEGEWELQCRDDGKIKLWRLQ